MKTLLNKIGKMTTGIAALLMLLTGLVFLAGCQKEDLAMNPTSNPTTIDLAKSNQSANNGAVDVNSIIYTLVSIDHLPYGTKTPDYKVEVSSKGIVTFTGRKNTSILGMHKFEISKEAVSLLRELFTESKFNEIYDELPLGMGGPKVVTSFQSGPSEIAITHVDYNGRFPSALVDIRQRAEIYLGISRFVNQVKQAGEETESATGTAEN